MPPFEVWERLLGFAIAACSALLAGSLWIQSLARVYPLFTFFLSFGALRSLFVATVKLKPSFYAYFFVTTELFLMVLYILMLIELYGLVFRKYEGIRTLSRVVVSVALGVSIVISAISLVPEMTASEKRRSDASEASKKKAPDGDTPGKIQPGPSTPDRKAGAPVKDRRLLLDLFMIAERGILSSLVLMILAMSVFLAWYPIELPRNVVLHSIVFAAFFLSKAAIILYRNIGHSQVADEWRSTVMMVGVACLMAWLVGLRRTGEARKVVVGHVWNREDEEELMAQLRGINAAMGRLAKE